MASFKAKLPVLWELIVVNDVRKIAKLMNTQRFDILSNDVIDHMMSFDILSNDVIYRNVGYSSILLFFAHHYYQYLSYNYIMLTLGVIGRKPHRGFWAPGVRHKARCAFVPMPGLYGTIKCYVVK